MLSQLMGKGRWKPGQGLVSVGRGEGGFSFLPLRLEAGQKPGKHRARLRVVLPGPHAGSTLLPQARGTLVEMRVQKGLKASCRAEGVPRSGVVGGSKARGASQKR